MPYDPSFPASHADLTSDVFRAQFQGLKELIDAVSGVTTAQVDGVTSLNPGEAATVLLSVSGNTLHLTFGIPRGNDGTAGANGANGTDGSNGQTGAQGPPFANAVVDSVATLNPGDAATVQTSFDGTNVHFTFGIPRGDQGGMGATGPQGPPFGNAVVDGVSTLNPGDNATVSVGFDGSNVRFQFGIPRGQDGTAGSNGANGTNGTNGNDGAPGQPGSNGNDGAQGPPGEVTSAQLQSAVNGTSNNTNAVSTLDTPFADADAESMRLRFNELVLALRR